MPKRVIRQRLLPYRILVDMWFGSYPWMTIHPDNERTIAHGPASRHFRISVGRFKDQLVWLHEAGFLPTVDVGKRSTRLALRLPPGVFLPLRADVEAAPQVTGTWPEYE